MQQHLHMLSELRNNPDSPLLTPAKRRMVELIQRDLRELSGIEYHLYMQIVFCGVEKSSAIRKIAFEEGFDVQVINKYLQRIENRIDEINYLDSL